MIDDRAGEHPPPPPSNSPPSLGYRGLGVLRVTWTHCVQEAPPPPPSSLPPPSPLPPAPLHRRGPSPPLPPPRVSVQVNTWTHGAQERPPPLLPFPPPSLLPPPSLIQGFGGSKGYLDTWCAGEALSVANHAHVVCVLFELGVSAGAAEEAGEALLFSLHSTAGVATREGFVTHHSSPLLALRVHTHVADG